MRAGMTKRQSEALAFIRGYTAERGYSPSYQEIADALDMASKSGVYGIVQSLVFRGLIVMRPGLARSIAIREGV